jgi:hypothetical protein
MPSCRSNAIHRNRIAVPFSPLRMQFTRTPKPESIRTSPGRESAFHQARKPLDSLTPSYYYWSVNETLRLLVTRLTAGTRFFAKVDVEPHAKKSYPLNVAPQRNSRTQSDTQPSQRELKGIDLAVIFALGHTVFYK